MDWVNHPWKRSRSKLISEKAQQKSYSVEVASKYFVAAGFYMIWTHTVLQLKPILTHYLTFCSALDISPLIQMLFFFCKCFCFSNFYKSFILHHFKTIFSDSMFIFILCYLDFHHHHKFLLCDLFWDLFWLLFVRFVCFKHVHNHFLFPKHNLKI